MGVMLRLAVPTIVMRSGALLMVMCDIVLLGRHSSQELAFYSLAQGPVMTLVLTGLGLLMGTLVLTSQFYGAGDFKSCGGVWRRSIPYALAIGLVICALCSTGPQIFLWFLQSEDLARGAAGVSLVLGVGIPGYMGYLASAYFLEGLKRPWPGTVIMLAGNVVNLILNLWWIEGGLGISAMGAEGAAWATTVSRLCLCVAAALWVWLKTDREVFGAQDTGARDPRAWALQKKLGYGAGLSIGIEAFAFGALNIMAGWSGAISLAAYAIGINILGMVFMMALGVGGSTSVLVGYAYGAKDYKSAVLAGWTGLGLNTLLEIPLMALFTFIPLVFAAVYTSDAAVLQVTAALIVWIAFILPFDGAQAVMSNALRGRGETFMPAVLQTGAFLLVMLPCGYIFSTGPLPGAEGLFAAILAGTMCSSSLLTIRFWVLAQKDRRKV